MGYRGIGALALQHQGRQCSSSQESSKRSDKAVRGVKEHCGTFQQWLVVFYCISSAYYSVVGRFVVRGDSHSRSSRTLPERPLLHQCLQSRQEQLHDSSCSFCYPMVNVFMGVMKETQSSQLSDARFSFP